LTSLVQILLYLICRCNLWEQKFIHSTIAIDNTLAWDETHRLISSKSGRRSYQLWNDLPVPWRNHTMSLICSH
jgi:hypothetical protein